MGYADHGGTKAAMPSSWFDPHFGYQRFGYLGASAQYQFLADRHKGFQNVLHIAGLTLTESATVRGDLDRRSGYAAMQKLMALPEPPTAICIDNNLAGIGAIRAMNNAGKVWGRDVSVIMYDGVGSDSVIRSAVTSLLQATPARAGQIMANMLLARLRGAAPESQQVLLSQILEPGTSDGPLP